MGHQTQFFRLLQIAVSEKKNKSYKKPLHLATNTNIGTKPPNLIGANFQLSRITRENKVQNKTDP